jgi:hypothetical protein
MSQECFGVRKILLLSKLLVRLSLVGLEGRFGLGSVGSIGLGGLIL